MTTRVPQFKTLDPLNFSDPPVRSLLMVQIPDFSAANNLFKNIRTSIIQWSGVPVNFSGAKQKLQWSRRPLFFSVVQTPVFRARNTTF